MMRSKVKRNPRVSVLRWAVVVANDGGFSEYTTRFALTYSTRDEARRKALLGDRVVRVRVTVEVVE